MQMTTNRFDFQTLKELYDQDINVMEYCRTLHQEKNDTISAVEVAYDLQTGTYINPKLSGQELEEYWKYHDRYTTALATLFGELGGNTILEVGVGEAFTLAPVIKKMKTAFLKVSGFDLSWSRVALGNRYSRHHGLNNVELFVGDVFEIPFQEHSFDIVYTYYSIHASSRGKEKTVLQELYKVAGQYLVLIEPSNELGNEETKQHTEQHQYCLDLYKHAVELGFKVVHHSLFGLYSDLNHQSSLLIIEVVRDKQGRENKPIQYACPICKDTLVFHRAHYFCQRDCLIFPVVGGIPCLRRTYGILGSKYLEYEDCSHC